MPNFSGFKSEGFRFFYELSERQDRDWFKAHKDEYEQLWVEPMKALLAELGPKLTKAYAGVPLAPPKIFRIHRDVRFSKDKTPFKTNIAAVIALKGDNPMETGAALYLHVGKETVFGAGHWALSPERLARYRKLIDSPKGAALAKSFDGLKKRGVELDSFEALKRVPKPFDPEHPRGELLKRKGCGFTLPKPGAKILQSAQLTSWLAEQIAPVAKVVVSLEKALK